MEFIYFKHPDTGGTFEAPDEDGVRERYEALGWTETDRPEDRPVVPSTLNPELPEAEWVTLWHPEAKSLHDFPNNPDSLSGAQEAGWINPPKQDPEEDQEDSENKPPAKETKSASKSTKVKAPAATDDSEEVK